MQDAFDICYTLDKVNQKQILKYLIPLQLAHGCYPTEKLFQKWGLKNAYSKISQACFSGEIADFENALTEQQQFLASSGLYILIERIRMVTFRNFIKRVAKVVETDVEFQIGDRLNIIRLDLLLITIND